jgi:hypothetical protein
MDEGRSQELAFAILMDLEEVLDEEGITIPLAEVAGALHDAQASHQIRVIYARQTAAVWALRF